MRPPGGHWQLQHTHRQSQVGYGSPEPAKGRGLLWGNDFPAAWGRGTTPTGYTIQAADAGLSGAPLHTQVWALQGRAGSYSPSHAHRLGAWRAPAQHFTYVIAA